MKSPFHLPATGMSQYKLFQNGLIIFFVVFSFTGYSIASRNNGFSDTIVKKKNTPNPQFKKHTFNIIPAAESTFGYEISDQGKIIVRQKTIPSLPGNKGFKTKDDAEKCAMLVISKLNRNIMPPTVTPKEIDSLGIRTTPDTHQQKH